MADKDLLLAIDQGGQSTRAIVFDRQGEIVATAREPLLTRRTTVEYVEQDAAQPGAVLEHIEHEPKTLLASIDAVIATVRDEIGQRGLLIASAGLATQRSTIVCWNRSTGDALSPVISWQDRRAVEILQRCAPADDVVRRITGLVRSPHYGASKLRWCLDELDAVAAAQAAGLLAMGPLCSFLTFHLVEDHPLCADPVNASRTLLWDVRALDWSDEMLNAFGLLREDLPHCVANKHAFGNLRGTSIPMTVCTGDQSAAIFAGGALDKGTAYINIGTGAFVLACVDQPPVATPLLHSVVWSADGVVTRVLEGTVNGAGSALAAQRASAADIAAAAPAIGSGELPLFLNGVSGLGSPYWRDNFASRFIGTGDKHAELAAVLESILFLLQLNLVHMADAVRLQRIVVSGGLAADDSLCQSLADLSRLPVHRSRETEATARGLAFLLAGQPAGWETEQRRVFRPCDNRHLVQRFAVWSNAMDAAL